MTTATEHPASAPSAGEDPLDALTGFTDRAGAEPLYRFEAQLDFSQRRPSMTSHRSHRLLQLGILLFLFGLLTGFAIPALANPRMGLSSHLEGVLNGIFLLALGLIWPRLRLGRGAAATTYWLAIYGTFANWAATLLAAAWGAGRTMPIAAGAHQGTATQETVIMALLFSLSLAVVAVCGLVLWGLRGDRQADGAQSSELRGGAPG